MKQLICLCLLFGISISSFAQIQTKMLVDISRDFSIEVRDNDASQRFNDVNFGVGAQFEKNWGEVEIKANYILSTAISSQIHPSQFQSHFLGGGFKYTFLKNGNRFRPFIEVSLAKEIYSNYENGYLSQYSFTPTQLYDYPLLPYTSYHLNFYDSTPFYGEVNIGCNIELIRNLNLGVAIGIARRTMLYRYGSYTYDVNQVLDNLEKYSKSEKRSKFRGIQIGLAYSFSFKQVK